MVVPDSWNQISVGQFIELVSIKVEDFNCEDEYFIQLLSILTDTDSTIIEEMDIDDFNQIKSRLIFLSKLPSKPPKQSIVIVNTDLHLYPDLYSMIIGEFIDLENLITSNSIENLPKILAILYRRMKINNDAFIPDEFESYGSWLNHRANIFNEAIIDDVYGVLNQYIKFRKHIYDNYSGLFDFDDSDSTEEIDVSQMSAADKLTYQKAIEQEKIVSKWGLDALLMKLANNDVTKINDVVKLPLLLCLNSLALFKELNIST